MRVPFDRDHSRKKKKVIELHSLEISLLCMHWLWLNLGILAKVILPNFVNQSSELERIKMIRTASGGYPGFTEPQ